MNRFDDEDKIISQFQEVNDNEVMFATQSEMIEAVYSSIHTEALWKNWINSSSKSDPPPDYYLPKDELMMDVMRVDDHAFVNKKGKIQNPTNAGESKLYKELKESGIQEIYPNAEFIVNAKTLLPSEQDHNYLFYKSNFERIVSEHIKSFRFTKATTSVTKPFYSLWMSPLRIFNVKAISRIWMKYTKAK